MAQISTNTTANPPDLGKKLGNFPIDPFGEDWINSLEASNAMLVDKLQQVLSGNGSVASGRLLKSIREGEVDNNGFSVVYQSYGQFVDQGRGRGFPPVKPIQDWIRERGIKPRKGQTVEQLSFAIAKKLAKRGYAPKPFIQPSINSTINMMADSIAEAGAQQIEQNAQEYFNTAGLNPASVNVEIMTKPIRSR